MSNKNIRAILFLLVGSLLAGCASSETGTETPQKQSTAAATTGLSTMGSSKAMPAPTSVTKNIDEMNDAIAKSAAQDDARAKAADKSRTDQIAANVQSQKEYLSFQAAQNDADRKQGQRKELSKMLMLGIVMDGANKISNPSKCPPSSSQTFQEDLSKILLYNAASMAM